MITPYKTKVDFEVALYFEKYETPKIFRCSPNGQKKDKFTSYGQAHLANKSTIQIENPDFSAWDRVNILLDISYINDHLELYPIFEIIQNEYHGNSHENWLTDLEC